MRASSPEKNSDHTVQIENVAEVLLRPVGPSQIDNKTFGLNRKQNI